MDNAASIIVLTAGGLNPDSLINKLSMSFKNLHVIYEHPESKLEILKRRSRLCGPIAALGQMATMIASRLGKRFATTRIKEILDGYALEPTLPSNVSIHHVDNINSQSCLSLIQDIAPSAILTVSCRLLKKSSLTQMPCPVVNLHAGINPQYRGQMGGYWSLIENDKGNFGATIHLVNSGVDTGATLYEVRVAPEGRDWIATYPLLLTAASVEHCRKALEDILSDNITPQSVRSGPSRLHFPPTLWQWLRHGLTKGIW